MENWQAIPEFEGYYEVSDLGNLRHLCTVDRFGRTYPAHLMKLYVHPRWGYLYVSLWKNGVGRSCRAHCLVAKAFLGERPTGADINHLDGDKTNNRLTNLEYCTRRENILHALDNGLSKRRGEDHPLHKLTADQVQEIRQLSTQGRLGTSLATQYGVSRAQISRIINHIRWIAVPLAQWREEFPE